MVSPAACISPATVWDFPSFFTHTNSTEGVLAVEVLPRDQVSRSRSRSRSATAALAVRPTPRMVAEPGPVQSP